MICILSSWCHCHPIISCSSKIQNGFTFLAPAYPGCCGQKDVKQMSNIIMYTCILHRQYFNVHLSSEPGSAIASWFFFTCSKSESLGSTWCSLYRPDAIPVILSPVWEHWRDVYIRHCMCCSFVVCQYVILQLSPPRRGQGERFLCIFDVIALLVVNAARFGHYNLSVNNWSFISICFTLSLELEPAGV